LHAVAEEHAFLRLLVLVLLFRPQGLLGQGAAMMPPARRRSAPRPGPARGLLAALLAAPLFVSDYLLSVLIIVLYFAYVGQAWNIMMGFAGQLSLGHALYVGSAPIPAAALFVHFGIGPWIGLPWRRSRFRWLRRASSAISASASAIGGVYFALLTIAFAEFTRIGFDHFALGRRLGGLFLPVANATRRPRGTCAAPGDVLLRDPGADRRALRPVPRAAAQPLGYYWQAIREDEEAARALGIDTFRYKMYRGRDLVGHDRHRRRVLRLLLQQPVSRADVLHRRSIEIILGPIIGGVGTLFGPIIGAFCSPGSPRLLPSC
jgi:branched-chain amino acid transport system permease protein